MQPGSAVSPGQFHSWVVTRTAVLPGSRIHSYSGAVCYISRQLLLASFFFFFRNPLREGRRVISGQRSFQSSK